MELTSEASKSKKAPQFNIYQYDAQLALAFQTDCENLLSKFNNFQNYSFKTFAQLWRETCFLSIFEGETYFSMLETFIENCFLIIKKFLFSNNTYVQTGALYLLYSLYYKQPVRDWVKIRLTQKDTEILIKIVDYHKENKSLEPVFIYNKMRLDGAFQHCALTQPLGLDAKFLKRYDLSKEQVRKIGLSESPLKKFKAFVEGGSILRQLEETDLEYQSLVHKYIEKCDKLYVFPSNSGNEAKMVYNKLFGEGFVEENPEENRLKDIKSRAMSNTGATYRAEKTVIKGVDLNN